MIGRGVPFTIVCGADWRQRSLEELAGIQGGRGRGGPVTDAIAWSSSSGVSAQTSRVRRACAAQY